MAQNLATRFSGSFHTGLLHQNDLKETGAGREQNTVIVVQVSQEQQEIIVMYVSLMQ